MHQSTTVGVADIMRAFAHISFFSHIKGKKREKYLHKLIQESFLRSYSHDDRIVRQGEHGHTMFVLLRGTVSVDAIVDGQKRQLAVLENAPGTTIWFGEGVIVGRTPRNATVSSVGPTILLEIEKIRLEKLDNVAVGVIDTIERESSARAVNSFLSQHRAFSVLDEGERKALLNDAKLRTAERAEKIFESGAPAVMVLIIKSGVAKLVRKGEGGTSVLAYFNSGDVVGMADGVTRPGSLISMGLTEYIQIPRTHFEAVRQRADSRIDLRSSHDPTKKIIWSDQLNKALNAHNNHIAVSNETGMLFVEEFIQEGAQVAQSLLTIDLDLCIRCGNCVRSCEARHDHAKMTRRGKKLVRRRDNEAGNYQSLLLPSSCRHCDSPECMIGCPTGAIHRKTTGEVAIHDFCIGCSNCALKCPWDNITMVETPDRWVIDRVTGGKLATPKIASKCDLCAGYDEANCVHNCPTKAILRVEPSYFPEVREMLGASAHAGEGRTESADSGPDQSRLIFAALFLAGTLGMVVLYASAPVYYAFSAQGFVLGGLGTFLMLAATALAGRRRMNRFPGRPPHPDVAADPTKAGRGQFGSLYLWARAHGWIGSLGLVAVLLHSGFSLGGVITSMLVFLLVLEIGTGLFGILYYKWMPKVITRLELDSQVEEDVADERDFLLRRHSELLADVEPDVKRVAKKAVKASGTRFWRWSSRYESAKAEAFSLERLAPLMEPLDRKHTALIQRIARDGVRLAEIRAIFALYQMRRGWLAMHITITAMLFTLLAVHIGSVALFYLRLSG